MFVKRVTVRRKWVCVEKNTLCFCLKTTGRLVRFVKWTIFKETIWKLQGNFAYRSCADKKESPWQADKKESPWQADKKESP
jgi:hypothetical protein